MRVEGGRALGGCGGGWLQSEQFAADEVPLDAAGWDGVDRRTDGRDPLVEEIELVEALLYRDELVVRSAAYAQNNSPASPEGAA